MWLLVTYESILLIERAWNRAANANVGLICHYKYGVLDFTFYILEIFFSCFADATLPTSFLMRELFRVKDLPLS